MTQRIGSGVANSNTLTFTPACVYPNGAKVFCAAIVESLGGKIVRQTAVQACDE